ncbi:MAG: ThiF family adenylyltransferase [Prevotellaceae bacterium]|jgi:molybdopterin/thiamine biosynthesis adenylyltransferase|nr:ThiF family adenylyltransferase [Prevotellaceae bacterium]
MRPIIYLYQEQLQDFLNNRTETAGVAYEWKGENVFHAYFDYPKVAPTGFPSVCLFLYCNPLENGTIENAIRHFSTANQGKIGNSHYIVGICLFIENGVVVKRGVVFDGESFDEAEVKYVPKKSELYSRSQGLLEVGALEKKRVLIVGLGSGGSQVAVELAKAGVGNFTLVDFDRIELHNIARHICGVNELGRLKTNAVRDAILLKNPYAKIKTLNFDMNEHLEEIEQEVIAADLTIAATDSLDSRYMLNALLLKHSKTGLFGRAVTRAEGGDVLRVRPGGPCYACITGSPLYTRADEISDLERARKSGVIPAYTSDEDAYALVQVGLSTDIAPINTMTVKIALLELSRGTSCDLSVLDSELTCDWYMWANRRDNHFKKWAPFNNNPEKKLPTILQWYAVRVSKDVECTECNYRHL